MERTKVCCLLLLLPLLVFSGRALYAYTPTQDGSSAEKVTLYFKFGSAVIDSAYLANPSSLRRIDSLMKSHPLADVDSIVIRGYASFDGPQFVNDLLAGQRAQSIRSYLLWKYPALDRNRIRVNSYGEYWDGVRQAAVANPAFPCREEVLAALDSGLSGDRLEARIKSIGQGRAYSYIINHIARQLRHASTYTVWFAEERPLPAPAGEVGPTAELPVELIVTGETPEEPLYEAILPKDATSGSPGASITQDLPPQDVAASVRTAMIPRWAVKTNMLYYAILMPNVEGEYYCSPHFSVAVSFQIAWWRQRSHDRFYQAWAVSPELRYWPGNRGAGNGFYVGAYATTGSYDIKWDRIGYWNDYVWCSGLNLGYIKPLRGRFALEFGLGFGYLQTQYEIYDRFYPMGEHYVYRGTDRTSYFGPTKATVGAVWRFGTGKTPRTYR